MSDDKSDALTICGYSRNLSKRDEAKKLMQFKFLEKPMPLAEPRVEKFRGLKKFL